MGAVRRINLNKANIKNQLLQHQESYYTVKKRGKKVQIKIVVATSDHQDTSCKGIIFSPRSNCRLTYRILQAVQGQPSATWSHQNMPDPFLSTISVHHSHQGTELVHLGFSSTNATGLAASLAFFCGGGAFRSGSTGTELLEAFP